MIGKKFVRREMIMIPQSVRMLEYYTCTYACDRCEKETGSATIFSTQAPPPLMKHSLASPSTVADVMAKKYVDGLPLARQEKIWARQEKIWARQGVELSRATLANWVIQTEKKWLKPLWNHMKQQIRDESVIHADETVVQVLKEPDKPATSESRMWVYASGEYSQKPVRIFEYQPDRKGDRAKAFLRGFSGCLVTDGYAGYNDVENAIRPFTLGRKNWLFCDSVKGAEASAVVYTLVETAKANGIDPYEYLHLVLTMLPYLGKNPSHEALEELMPWHPKVKNIELIRDK